MRQAGAFGLLLGDLRLDARALAKRGHGIQTADAVTRGTRSSATFRRADQNLIAAVSHAVFASAIELGSGIGLWLVFGRGAAAGTRPDAETLVVMPATTRCSGEQVHA